MMLKKGKITLPTPMLEVRKHFERILTENETVIVARTKQGKTIDGRNFKKYSKGYAAFRAKGGWSTKPDLWYRGDMLRSIGSRITRMTNDFIEGRITIAPDQQDKAKWNQEKRPFFGLSKKQLKYINDQIGALIHGGK